jgi:hypothetical protein
MNPSIIDRLLFKNITKYLFLLIPITFFGFYPSYFSQINSTPSYITHLHAGMMVIWLALVIAQPILIEKKKSKTHRLIGRLSYALMPLIIFSGYLILRYSYHRALSGEEVGPPGYYPADLPLHIKAAEFVVIGNVYWVWLIVYYVLGVSFRKQTIAHATFMLAAALTILGPSGDRLVGHICDGMDWNYNAFAENFVFGLVLIVFASLFLLHFKRKLLLWPSLMVLAIQIIGIFFYYNMPYHPAWSKLAAWMFNH